VFTKFLRHIYVNTAIKILRRYTWETFKPSRKERHSGTFERGDKMRVRDCCGGWTASRPKNLGGHRSRRHRRRCNDVVERKRHIERDYNWPSVRSPILSHNRTPRFPCILWHTRAAVAEVTVYDLNISEIPGEAFLRSTRGGALSLLRVYRCRKVRLSAHLFSIVERPRARQKFFPWTNPGIENESRRRNSEKLHIRVLSRT